MRFDAREVDGNGIEIQLCGNQIMKYARNEFYFPRYKCEAHMLYSVVTAAAALKVMVKNMYV